VSGNKIAADPHDLSREATRLRNAAAEVDTIIGPLKANLPPMPAPVRTHVEGELGWAMVALQQFGFALVDEGARVDTRSRLFEKAGEGGLAAALAGFLGALDRVSDPMVTAFERTLTAPRYVRFGTWVRAYQYVNKYGTTVKVGKHWRNLSNKWMQERQVFSAIGEDSKLAKAVDAAGKAGVALAFVAAGFEEYEEDRDVSEARRIADSAAVGASTAGGAWAGAEAGGELGATIGSFAGPEGTVIGGVIGGVGGGIVGSKVGHDIGHFIVHDIF